MELLNAVVLLISVISCFGASRSGQNWHDSTYRPGNGNGATENYDGRSYSQSSSSPPPYSSGDHGGYSSGGGDMGSYGSDVDPYSENDIGGGYGNGGGYGDTGHGGGYGHHDGGHGGWEMQRPVKTIIKHKVKNIAVPHPVPAPVAVPVPKYIRYFKPFPVAKPVAVPEVVPVIKHIQKPVAFFTSIPVARTVPVPKFVRLPVQVRVPKPVLVRVPKIVPVAKKFPIPVEVHVPKPYLVPVYKSVPVPVPHKVPKYINIIREVPEIVKKPVPVYVDDFSAFHESANLAAYGSINPNPFGSSFDGSFNDDDFEATYSAGMGTHSGRFSSYHGNGHHGDVSGHYQHGNQEYRHSNNNNNNHSHKPAPPRAHRSQGKQRKQASKSSASSTEPPKSTSRQKEKHHQNAQPQTANTSPSSSSVAYPRSPSYSHHYQQHHQQPHHHHHHHQQQQYGDHSSPSNGYPYSGGSKYYDSPSSGHQAASQYSQFNGQHQQQHHQQQHHQQQQQYSQNSASYGGGRGAQYSQPHYSQPFQNQLSQALHAYNTNALQKAKAMSDSMNQLGNSLQSFPENNHLSYDQGYNPLSASFGGVSGTQSINQYGYNGNDIPQTNSISYHYSTNTNGMSPLNPGVASYGGQAYTVYHPPSYANAANNMYQTGYAASPQEHTYPKYGSGDYQGNVQQEDQSHKNSQDPGYPSKDTNYSPESSNYYPASYDGSAADYHRPANSVPGIDETAQAYGNDGDYGNGYNEGSSAEQVNFANKGEPYNGYPTNSNAHAHASIVDQISSYTASFSTTHSLSSNGPSSGDVKSPSHSSDPSTKQDEMKIASGESSHGGKPEALSHHDIQYSPAYSEPDNIGSASNSSVVHLESDASTKIETTSSPSGMSDKDKNSQKKAKEMDIDAKLKDIFLYSPKLETKEAPAKREPEPSSLYEITPPNPKKNLPAFTSPPDLSRSEIFIEPRVNPFYSHKQRNQMSSEDIAKNKQPQASSPNPVFIPPSSQFTSSTEKMARASTKPPGYWSPPVFKTVQSKDIGKDVYSSQDVQIVDGPSNVEKNFHQHHDPSPAYKPSTSSTTATVRSMMTVSPATYQKFGTTASTVS